jgi:hypothetical protein
LIFLVSCGHPNPTRTEDCKYKVGDVVVLKVGVEAVIVHVFEGCTYKTQRINEVSGEIEYNITEDVLIASIKL